MAVNDSYTKSTDGLADTNDLIIDGSAAGTGAINITEVGGTGDCEVYREVDSANDGTWAVSVKMDSPTNTWHSQENDLLASQSQNTRLRIKNVSGGAIDVFAAGYEVDD